MPASHAKVLEWLPLHLVPSVSKVWAALILVGSSPGVRHPGSIATETDPSLQPQRIIGTTQG